MADKNEDRNDNNSSPVPEEQIEIKENGHDEEIDNAETVPSISDKLPNDPMSPVYCVASTAGMSPDATPMYCVDSIETVNAEVSGTVYNIDSMGQVGSNVTAPMYSIDSMSAMGGETGPVYCIDATGPISPQNIPQIVMHTGQSVNGSDVSPPNGTTTSLQRSTSPQTFVPCATNHSRGGSPQSVNPSSSPTSNHQHVVHVHVNPGETFSFRLGDQIQQIHGPATVRMVSSNGPPLPMPMQVPPGHMVQQIVDEHGILTHVILSPQPPGMPGTAMTGGPNNAPQYYPPYGPHYATHPQYQSGHHHTHHNNTQHIHSGMHNTPPPHSCNNHSSVHNAGASPPLNSPEDRANRQKAKIRKKFSKRMEEGYYRNNSSNRRNNKGGSPVNGNMSHGNSYTSYSSSEAVNGDMDEDTRLSDILSTISEPRVTDTEARCASVQWSHIELDKSDLSLECDRTDLDTCDIQYELIVSDRGSSDRAREGKSRTERCGNCTEYLLKDLKPATEYSIRLCAILDDVRGSLSCMVTFKTDICEPDPPQQPKLSAKSKTYITLKWNATSENGAKISTYTLEYDQGLGDGNFVEIYNGLQRQHKVSKLLSSMRYTFRLAAINSVGKSPFCEPVSFCTSGSAPSQPDPPMLSEAYVTALMLSWISRPGDDEFLLQMEDEATGHGFLTVYNGTSLSYTVPNLRRNTEYNFKMACKNDEGQSKWSDSMRYSTLPDRPGPPSKPQIKGKTHAHSFRVTWDPPKDNGGCDVTKYIIEFDDGRGHDVLYEGSEREHCFDHLTPGQNYRVRVAAISKGGRSDFSDWCMAKTQSVPPGQCQAPKLQGKPKATSLHLRWSKPDYDGGSPVTDFTAQQISPDNSCRDVYKGRDMDCIVAGLLPGRPYLFQVRAFNSCGGGPWSLPLEVISGAGMPDPPKTPSVVCKSSHTTLVSWEEPVNNGATITEYKLEWLQKAEQEFSQLYLGPSLCYEVKNLLPATEYKFRVQAVNSAGAGSFSSVKTYCTPASSPAAVVTIYAKTTATTVSLHWKEPNCHGDEITSYNISVGERQIIPVGNDLEYLLEDLSPETSYKLRIQAVNSVGEGPFSSTVKVTTRALPPKPPRMECLIAAPNSLKLKWGEGRNLEMLSYTLEMERDDGSFVEVYTGPGQTYKVNRISELTNYDFRIFASNEAGSGPYSECYTFSTTKAPPPSLKGPRVSEISLASCDVDWQGCRQMGNDLIVYQVQLQCSSCKEREYKQVYRGVETRCRVEDLQPKTDYQVRVCAIRQSDETGDLFGPYSPGVSFSTPSPELPKPITHKVVEAKLIEPKQLTDQQWAMIILLGFVIFAVLVAFVAQQILSYTSGHSLRADET